MRVLLISQEMPPETGWGGIGTYVATLAPALADAGAEVRILSVVQGQARSDDLRSGVVVHRRPLRRPRGLGRATGLRESWDRVSLSLAVDRELRALDFEPDVIETPEWRAEGLVTTARRTAPVTLRLHSAAQQLFPFVKRQALDARAAVALERRAVLAADLVISTRANLAALGPSFGHRLPPSRAIPLPVPELTAAPIPPNAPRVLFVGRLERVKGPEILLASVRGVLRAVPEARFSFVGADTGRAPGSYLELLRGQIRAAGIEHAVAFCGHLPHPDVLSAIRRCWLCAFPSRQESFGYAAAEAAALGRPVVASHIPAFVDLFGRKPDAGARLVSGDRPEDWTAAIVELLQSRKLAATMGEAARARVRELCGPARIAAATLEAYDEARANAATRRRR